MADPSAKISAVRKVLSRYLAPRVVAAALAELEEAADPPVKPKASPEAIERARTWARREARR